MFRSLPLLLDSNQTLITLGCNTRVYGIPWFILQCCQLLPHTLGHKILLKMSSDAKQQSDQYKGWVYKWTNYIKGYQKRWFVLQNGLLSYYRWVACLLKTALWLCCPTSVSVADEIDSDSAKRAKLFSTIEMNNIWGCIPLGMLPSRGLIDCPYTELSNTSLFYTDANWMISIIYMNIQGVILISIIGWFWDWVHYLES